MKALDVIIQLQECHPDTEVLIAINGKHLNSVVQRIEEVEQSAAVEYYLDDQKFEYPILLVGKGN